MSSRRRRLADITGAGQQPAEADRIPTQARQPSDEDLAVAAAASRWVRAHEAAVDASAAPLAPTLDLDALVERAMDRREAERRQAEADARYDKGRSPSGEPCAACGVESALLVGAHGETAAWRTPPDNIGWWCEQCWQELHTAMATAADCRVSAIRQRLNCSIPLRALGDPGAFSNVRVYWREFPGASPATHPDARWSHVNIDELRRQWEAVAHPHAEPPEWKPPTAACPRCGVRNWRPDWRTITSEGRDWGPITTGARFTATSAACGGEPDDRPESAHEPRINTDTGGLARSEADRVAAQLLGVREAAYGRPVIPGLALQVGFRWFYETAGDRHGRSNSEPWQHFNVRRARQLLDRAEVS